jgi:hypothetical protein
VKDDKHTAASSVLGQYARASCHELCEAVYSTFPREVRDIIYGHLNYLSEGHIDYRSGSWGTVGYFKSTSEADWQLCSNQRGRPRKNHWWDVDFVGDYMRREMSEHYFRSVRFLFDTYFEWLPKFRVTDQWKLGFCPVEIVLNIGVTIQCGDLDFKGL